MTTRRWSDTVAGHRAAQRDHIVAVALELVTERGMAGVSMSLLAERAELSRATLYHYFPDLDHVLMAWVGDKVRRFTTGLAAKLDRGGDPAGRLRLAISEVAGYFDGQEHRVGFEHLEGQAVSPLVRQAVRDHMAPLREALARVVVEGVADGTFRPGLDPELHADLVLGLLGVLRPHLARGERPPDQVAGSVADLVLDGVGAGSRRRPAAGESRSPGRSGPRRR